MADKKRGFKHSITLPPRRPSYTRRQLLAEIRRADEHADRLRALYYELFGEWPESRSSNSR